MSEPVPPAPANSSPNRSLLTETAPEDRVPVAQKLAIAAGEISSIGRQSVDNLALPFYNVCLGVSPVLVTAVLSIARLLDAFTDPLAGSISDNTQTRWGRRKPFLLVASIVCGLTLPLVWMPSRGWTEIQSFAYFFVTLLLYFGVYSFFNVPLIALALEATPDYKERTRVVAYKGLVVQCMGLLGSWLFAITQLGFFRDTIHGARWIGLGMGLLVMVTGLIPVILVREGYRKITVTKKRMPFWQGIRVTFMNRSFVLLSAIAMGAKMSGPLVQALGLYILIYYVYGGDTKAAAKAAGLFGTVLQLTTIACIPLVTYLANRWGKIRALEICLWILIVGSISKWITYKPENPYYILVTAVLIAPGQAAFFAIIRSIVADICDADELQTGMRREGMYGAMHSWIEKALGSLAVLLTGTVIVLVGFHQEAGAHQAPHALTMMRAAFVFIPVVAVSLALVALRYFPLTPARTFEIRQELERRRGKTR
jgi:GPH family glycoside/pentoside/hexuronide:cation symporter